MFTIIQPAETTLLNVIFNEVYLLCLMQNRLLQSRFTYLYILIYFIYTYILYLLIYFIYLYLSLADLKMRIFHAFDYNFIMPKFLSYRILIPDFFYFFIISHNLYQYMPELKCKCMKSKFTSILCRLDRSLLV